MTRDFKSILNTDNESEVKMSQNLKSLSCYSQFKLGFNMGNFGRSGAVGSENAAAAIDLKFFPNRT